MFKVTAYHGTPNNRFDRFDITPIFFTTEFEIAKGYAHNQYARDDDDKPGVITASLSFDNPITIYKDELLVMIGDEHGNVDWSCFDNIVCKYECMGYDGIILKGVLDFTGMNGDERKTNVYDQYVAFTNKSVTINDYKEV